MGVYIEDFTGDPDDWPRTETIHKLIYEAIDGHTSVKPISKRACVRVIYRSPYADQDDLSYHIDLPIYGFKKSSWSGEIKTVIGFKGDKQWSENSNPESFTAWFFEKCRKNPNDPEQLKRVVKYLKAWKENMPSSPKLPSGMILTVLAAKNFKPHQRDDIALFNTISEFEHLLSLMFSISKPTEPFDDLSETMSDAEEENFMYRIDKMLDVAKEAIDAKTSRVAFGKWGRIFGDRFKNIERIRLLD